MAISDSSLPNSQTLPPKKKKKPDLKGGGKEKGRRDSQGPGGGEGFSKKDKIKTISIIKSQEKEKKWIRLRVQGVCVCEGEGVEEGSVEQWV